MAERTRRYGTKTAAWSGIVVVLLALVPAVLRIADGRAGWPEALFILAGAGFIIFHASRLVLLQRLARTRPVGGAASTGSGNGGDQHDGGPR